VKAICDAALSSKAMPRLRRVELNGNKFSEEDPNVEKVREMLAGRKESAGEEYPEVDEDDEEAWGLDELDELDDEDEDDDEEDGEDAQEEDEFDGKEGKVLKEADEAESEPVSQKKDPDVEEIAASCSPMSGRRGVLGIHWVVWKTGDGRLSALEIPLI